MTRRLLVGALSAGVCACAPVVIAAAQPLDELTLELVCQASEDTPKWDLGGGKFAPKGPRELKVRVNLPTKTVELLDDDGSVLHRAVRAVVTERTIKWGLGYAGLAREQYVSEFDGTIDRELGTLRTDWDDPRRGLYRMQGFKGRCRRATRLF
jgi:hypothetical protein